MCRDVLRDSAAKVGSKWGEGEILKRSPNASLAHWHQATIVPSGQAG